VFLVTFGYLSLYLYVDIRVVRPLYRWHYGCTVKGGKKGCFWVLFWVLKKSSFWPSLGKPLKRVKKGCSWIPLIYFSLRQAFFWPFWYFCENMHFWVFWPCVNIIIFGCKKGPFLGGYLPYPRMHMFTLRYNTHIYRAKQSKRGKKGCYFGCWKEVFLGVEKELFFDPFGVYP